MYGHHGFFHHHHCCHHHGCGCLPCGCLVTLAGIAGSLALVAMLFLLVL